MGVWVQVDTHGRCLALGVTKGELLIQSILWPSGKDGWWALACHGYCSLASGEGPEWHFSLSSATIEKEMRKLFNIPAERETRLWNRYMSNTYEQLSKLDNTVQDAGLYQGQVGGSRPCPHSSAGLFVDSCLLILSMSDVRWFAYSSYGFRFHPGASNWAPKWRWHMAKADPAVKVSEFFLVAEHTGVRGTVSYGSNFC